MATTNHYTELHYLDPEDFIRRVTVYSDQHPNIAVKDVSSNATFWIKTNDGPRFWTTFDNKHIIFDGYNSNIDSTLQESKSVAWGEVIPEWRMEDDFVPELDASLFSLLLAEAKKACFINMKQVANANEENRARRQLTRWQNDKYRAGQRKDYPDYGRRR